MLAYGATIKTKFLKYGSDLGFKGRGQMYLKSVKICSVARNANSDLSMFCLRVFILSAMILDGVHVTTKVSDH